MEQDIKTYYTAHSVFTNPGARAELLADMPASAAPLAETLRGLMLMHDDIAKYPIQNERVRDTLCRYAAAILDRLAEMDKKTPLTQKRPEDQRFVANSSDFALLCVSVLRQKGVSARKRTGFVPCDVFYDGEQYYRLHDIVEYREGDAWQRLDPSGLSKPEDFIPAGKAWQDCRVGHAAPDKFRDEEHRDFEILTAALLLDLANLGKRELTVWDRYGWACKPFAEFDSRQWQKLDDLAIALQKGDEAQEELIALYNGEEGLQVPQEIWCASPVVPPHLVRLKS